MSQAKPTHYPDLTVSMDVSPADIHGALKENAKQLIEYLHNNAWMQINCPEVKKHLDGMVRMLGHLNNMQATLAAAQEAHAEQADAVKN